MPSRSQGESFRWLMDVKRLSLTNPRNRDGLNDWIYEKEHPSEAK